jgi:hypothetical protein
VARGQLDYLIPGLLGFLSGGVIFGMIYRADLIQWLLTAGRPELAYAKLPDVLGVDPLLLTFVFSEAILLFLYVLGKTRAHRRDSLESIVEQERVEAGLVDAPAKGAGD